MRDHSVHNLRAVCLSAETKEEVRVSCCAEASCRGRPSWHAGRNRTSGRHDAERSCGVDRDGLDHCWFGTTIAEDRMHACFYACVTRVFVHRYWDDGCAGAAEKRQNSWVALMAVPELQADCGEATGPGHAHDPAMDM